jgi:hypothetical protein
VSRHHMLPPIVYTPAPPKPKETRRRRGIGYAESTGESDETAEAGEASHATPPRATAPQQNPSAPIEAAERRIASTTGKLSDGTLKELLLAQEHEQESTQCAGGTVPAAKE